MASTLGHLSVIPFSTKGSGKLPAAEVARRFHYNDRTSSRTKCKRIDCGLGASKKYPSTASSTISRSSSHVSPCVTIDSVKHSATYAPSGSCVTLNTSSLGGVTRSLIRSRIARGERTYNFCTDVMTQGPSTSTVRTSSRTRSEERRVGKEC